MYMNMKWTIRRSLFHILVVHNGCSLYHVRNPYLLAVDVGRRFILGELIVGLFEFNAFLVIRDLF